MSDLCMLQSPLFDDFLLFVSLWRCNFQLKHWAHLLCFKLFQLQIGIIHQNCVSFNLKIKTLISEVMSNLYVSYTFQ